MIGSDFILSTLTAGALALAKDLATDVVKRSYRALKTALVENTEEDRLVDQSVPPDEDSLTSNKSARARQELAHIVANLPQTTQERLTLLAKQLSDELERSGNSGLLLKAPDLLVSDSSLDIAARQANIDISRAKIVEKSQVRIGVPFDASAPGRPENAGPLGRSKKE